MYEFNMSKCIDDFNRQCNIFLADFKYCRSHIRNVLFQRYCTSFYGTQLLPHFDTNIHDVYTPWRIAIRRMWHLPWRTHNNMLVHVAGVMEPELWFEMALISENNTVYTISNMGQYSSYSIMDANIKLFNDKYCTDERNVYTTWRDMCEKNEDVSECIYR